MGRLTAGRAGNSARDGVHSPKPLEPWTRSSSHSCCLSLECLLRTQWLYTRCASVLRPITLIIRLYGQRRVREAQRGRLVQGHTASSATNQDSRPGWSGFKAWTRPAIPPTLLSLQRKTGQPVFAPASRALQEVSQHRGHTSTLDPEWRVRSHRQTPKDVS